MGGDEPCGNGGMSAFFYKKRCGFAFERLLRNLDKDTAIRYYFSGQKLENLGEIHYK